MQGKQRAVGLFLGLTLVAVSAGAPATSQSQSVAGTLSLQALLRVLSTGVTCPPAPPATECRARTGEGIVSGLGSVSEIYTWSYRMGPPTCPSDDVGKPLATSARLIVAGKGEIHVALADGGRCVNQEPIRNEPQAFTITGGTGRYDGASGSGIVERAISAGSGTERWMGTLVVPGVEFDVTPPTLSGAGSKTVRVPKGARGARVAYAVNARDDVDGAVAVSCRPPSGSRFKVGRTTVTCSASDSSGNTATARFTVRVTRRR